jgi:hypothetical protein
LELGEKVNVTGTVALTVVCPFTNSHPFALDAVAVKLVAARELETVTLVACGRLPPVLYVHRIEA